MLGLTNLLITAYVMKRLCGRGPALFGIILFVVAIPFAILVVLIDQLYPAGFATFAWKALRTFLLGFH